MEYDNLGKTAELTAGEIYVKLADESTTATDAEIKKAKTLLSIVSPKSNISLYDHLRDIIEDVLRYKRENAVDIIGELSHSLKQQRYDDPTQFEEAEEINNTVTSCIEIVRILLQSFEQQDPPINQDTRNPEDDERLEDEELQDSLEMADEAETQESWSASYIQDVTHQMFRFRQCGVGLNMEEAFQINLALKALATRYKLERVRFWGKIYGLRSSYYVAEVPYSDDIQMDEDVTNGEDNDTEEVESPEEEKSSNEAEESTTPTYPTPEEEDFKIPPLPELQLQGPTNLPTEENGTGANKYLYFVCSSSSDSWTCLPQLTPRHIIDARAMKLFFTGNMDTEVRGYVAFDGNEAYYLRAQIARITASTSISPLGYYKIPKEDEEEETKVNEEQTSGVEECQQNKNFIPKTVKDLVTENLNGWVHYREAFNAEGGCMKNVAEGEDENPESADEEETQEREDEEHIPLLREISKDKGADGVTPWSIRMSSSCLEECAVMLIRSNIWPGAFIYYDGTNFENVYIGYGLKYSTRHFAPKLGYPWQKEYPVGPEIIEPLEFMIETASEGNTLSEDTEENTDSEQPGEEN